MKVAKPKRDKSLPYSIGTLTTVEDDCFTNEWEVTHKTCVKCGQYEECMVETLRKNFDRSKDISKGYFDETNWDLVPWDSIIEQIICNPGNVNLSELCDVVFKLSKCPDKKTCKLYTQNWLLSNKFIVKKGNIYHEK